ncbi:hypothetical protein GMO_01680 [Gluconobacter morbifer G707]|uniref:Uncharacterized protein n=1 Tax=Gluconobacter morbifer G707 TaxID=1088869 RepID=G6XFA3_9PROT|nr:hypothetical protein GMO_01680 [Gluconobacter morbifer G707]
MIAHTADDVESHVQHAGMVFLTAGSESVRCSVSRDDCV